MTNLDFYVTIGHVFNITLPNFHSEEKSKTPRMRITDLLGHIQQVESNQTSDYSTAMLTLFSSLCAAKCPEELNLCQATSYQYWTPLGPFPWPNNQSVF